jgi:hypothetical protein
MSLKNLIALQAKQKANASPTTQRVQKTELTPAPATEKPKAGAIPGGFKFGAVTKPGSPPKIAPKPVTPAPAPAPAKPVTQLDDDFSLDDLANLDVNQVDPADRRNIGSGFDDEIDATAPERILPPDLTKQQLDFVESLNGIYEVLHDPEMFGQSVRIVMLELAENKEYKKLIVDEDVHVIIRGMRNVMGLAKIKKQEKSRKTGGASKAKGGKNSPSSDDMAMLDELFGGDDD